MLNSKFINFFIKEKYKFTGMDGGISFTPKVISSIPIPSKIDKEKQSKFKTKSEELTLLKIEQLETINNFKKLLSFNFEKIKINRKLMNIYNFNFTTLIRELKKQNIKLTLETQLEWNTYYEKNRTKLNIISTKIFNKTAEIDKMIYKLYELTDKEIEIIEAITK